MRSTVIFLTCQACGGHHGESGERRLVKWQFAYGITRARTLLSVCKQRKRT